MSELGKLRDAADKAQRRQDEAATTLSICRVKFREAEAEWHRRFNESNEARARLQLARTAQSVTTPKES